MYHLRQALSGIRRAGFMSAACIIIMTFSLLILGIFLFATSNLREILKFAYEKVEIVAFLGDGTTEGMAGEVQARAEEISYIDEARYVSPDEALARLKQEFGERSYILDALEENPLPASIEITLKPQYRLKDRVVAVAERVAALPGVEDVTYGSGWIAKLERIVRVLALADVGIGLIVGIASIVTVSYTVRLTLFARRENIRIMKLVGATDSFIMAPFLLEGLIHGAISVVSALVVIFLGYRVVDVKLPQVIFMPVGIGLVFVLFGLVVAVLGSWVSLRAFLKERTQP